MASTAGIQTRDAGFDIVPPLVNGTNDKGSLSINADTININSASSCYIGNILNPFSTVTIYGIVYCPLGLNFSPASFISQW